MTKNHIPNSKGKDNILIRVSQIETMKKHILDLTVISAEMVHERYVLLRLTDPSQPLPPMLPGQFVEVRIDGSSTTFLRRPISICFVDSEQNELWLLVACVGDGTRWLATLSAGDRLNFVLPLGNGFSIKKPCKNEQGRDLKPLLVGGGVGVAPLLYLGAMLRQGGTEPTFLLGARTGHDLLLIDEFSSYGPVFVTTEDGSEGERGFVTNHSVLNNERFNMIYTCGPTPMMKAVARYAREHYIDCEASLENMMACGLGACLCCVEKTRRGNLCVCKDGPVFNIEELLWLN
jgi:dihydroorotate dehydrogenase electron transfer subunit